jgi:hypothetical protein
VAVDQEPEMLDCIGGPAREALAARDVVRQVPVLGMGLEQLASAVGGLGVLARLVQRPQRPPDLGRIPLVGAGKVGSANEPTETTMKSGSAGSV